MLAVQEGERFISKLNQLGLQVIIEAPLPVFKAPPFRGSDWFNRMNPVARPGYVVGRDFMLDHRARAMQSIHDVAVRLSWRPRVGPLLHLLFRHDLFRLRRLQPLFFDGDHLSNYGARKAYPSFKATLEKIWN